MRADTLTEERLPHDGFSFLQLDGPVLPSAMYVGDGALHMRFHEYRGAGGSAVVALDWEPERVTAVDFQGRPVDATIKVSGTQVVVDVAPWQIVTLKLEGARSGLSSSRASVE
jgi:hypothetical protein